VSDSDAARARAERKATKRGKQRRREAWRVEMHGTPDRAALADAMTSRLGIRRGPRAAPADGTAAGRWVPIGPSVVRLGQAIDRPRVTGRINDLAVEPVTGRRAYAASGNGGVWYTDDAGATWSPVGPWAERARVAGGRNSATTGGSILVSWGATAAQDVVLVGTGELATSPNPDAPSQGGIGVLTAMGPTTLAAPLVDPWEPDANSLALLEGAAASRIVRDPTRTAGSTAGPTQDRVVACTTRGVFVGVRTPVPAGGGYPGRGTYQWTAAAAAWPAAAPAGWPANPVYTDALWLPGGRLVLAVFGFGLVTSDDVGATLGQVPSLDATTTFIDGRISIALAAANRIYVLCAAGGAATVYQIPDATLNPPVAALVGNVPAVFGSGQADYDQCIVADRAPVLMANDLDGTGDGFVDRLFMGGDTITPTGTSDWAAAMWVMDVQAAVTLQPAPGLSTTGVAPAGDGATNAGLVGNNVHPDVHVIRLAGPAGNRTVWVGCDGGIFVSTQGGRVHTFAPRVTGLATLEAGYLAAHPTSNQFLAVGVQDNGVLVRTGDTVWEEHFEGDGGGVAFHPTASDVLIGQWTQGSWQCNHASFRDPLQRRALHPNWGTIGADRENGVSAFYAGAASVAHGAGGRVAVGTNRIWVSDDLGGGAACTWRVLPFATWTAGSTALDRRTAGGADINVASTTKGTPSGGSPVTPFGMVRTIKWVSDTELLAVFARGICRWRELSANVWRATPWSIRSSAVAIESTQTITDIAPVPSTRDFYVTTLGATGTDRETVWWYSSATDRFRRTNFRHQLDTAGPTLGPLDPVYAVVVDPGNSTTVYVGTATGVWQGERQDDNGTHTWLPYVNGLPQATVQDLSLWVDPTPPPPLPGFPVRLLRAAVQSRGVWEVDLSRDSERRTFVRVHPHDDRRMLPVRLVNPRVAPAPPTNFTTDSSPDITVRAQWPLAAAPRWIGPNPITALNVPSAYELWLFQSAFRWLYPSVVPTGQWTQAFGDLVALDRSRRGPMLPGGPLIDQQLWNAVLGTRLAAGLSVSANPADDLAVARAPWTTALSPTQAATEIDLMEAVVPPSTVGGVWTVYSEPSTIDVLLHHRDSRAAGPGQAWAVLLWRYVASAAAGLTAPVAGVTDFHTSAWTTPATGVGPAGWIAVRRPDGSARLPLDFPLDARMPRAVAFDVDLTRPRAPLGQPQPLAPVAVVFLALVGSIADDPPLAPPAPAAVTVNDLVTQWPYAAARVCLLQPRP